MYVFSGKWKRVTGGSVERHEVSSERKGEIQNYWAALRTHLDFVVKNLKWDQPPPLCVSPGRSETLGEMRKEGPATCPMVLSKVFCTVL